MGKIIRNGIEYSGSYDNAISVNYDNTNSGLTATTVQEGIDEIKEGLKPHANVNPIANLLTTETGYALDATQGKVLNDKITESLVMPFVNYSANDIHTITTHGASWTATEDCYCIASMGATTGVSANVSIDGVVAVATGLTTSSTITYPYMGTCYVKKGQVVATKNNSGHKYHLLFKPLLK